VEQRCFGRLLGGAGAALGGDDHAWRASHFGVYAAALPAMCSSNSAYMRQWNSFSCVSAPAQIRCVGFARRYRFGFL
jgi:hypothetical protein